MGKDISVLVMCAEGVEEMEFMTICDVLLRFGFTVVTCGVSGDHEVTGRNGLYLRPECGLREVRRLQFDAVVLPGGEDAAEAFGNSSTLGRILKDQYDRGALVCAMCASPLALKKHHIGYGCRLTSYPSLQEKLKKYYSYKQETVVVDDNLVTSRGPGTASDFALTIGRLLSDKCTAKKVASGMLL